MPNKYLINCNNNIVCAIDVETSGPTPGEDDLIQVCIMPLNSNLEPNKDIFPFYCDLKPKFPENFPYNEPKQAGRPSKERFYDACERGLDPYIAADLFDEWFKKLDLQFGKKIIPLAHNWAFNIQFIVDWLGSKSVNCYFDRNYRDTQATAVYLNDCAEFHIEPLPHPKTMLSYLASIYRVPHERKHDSLANCVINAEIYRSIIKKSLFHVNAGSPPKIPSENLEDTRPLHLLNENEKYAKENYQEGTLSFLLANFGYKLESENHAKEVIYRLILENEWYQRNI